MYLANNGESPKPIMAQCYAVAELTLTNGVPVRSLAVMMFHDDDSRIVRANALYPDGRASQGAGEDSLGSPLLDFLALVDVPRLSMPFVRGLLHRWHAPWPLLSDEGSASRVALAELAFGVTNGDDLLESLRVERENWWLDHWGVSGGEGGEDRIDVAHEDFMLDVLLLADVAWLTLASDLRASSPRVSALPSIGALIELDEDRRFVQRRPADRLLMLGIRPVAALRHLQSLVAVPFLQEAPATGKGTWSRQQRARAGTIADREYIVDNYLPTQIMMEYVTDDIAAVAWHEWWWCVRHDVLLHRCTACGGLFLNTGRQRHLCGDCSSPSVVQSRYRKDGAGSTAEKHLADARRKRLAYWRQQHPQAPEAEIWEKFEEVYGREPTAQEKHRLLHPRRGRPRAK